MSNDDIKIPVLIGGQVRHVDLAVLLRGIVPAEVPAVWPFAVVVCQAILARTYVLRAYGWGWRHGTEAAICDRPGCCLAYNPGKVHPLTDDAVRRTEGLVVAYGGEIARVFWSAYCGGHTRSNFDAGWVKEKRYELPYLAGVECPCSLFWAEVEDKLNEQGRFGHGIGFCQYGARALVKQGRLEQRIGERNEKQRIKERNELGKERVEERGEFGWLELLGYYFGGGIEVCDWEGPWAMREAVSG